MIEYEPVIGLEVHAQLLTQTKMFCACRASFGSAPNTNVCPVCLGLPGALPVPNLEAIRMAVRAAIALGCEVKLRSQFARKNYFYPDLSKGYQISQFELPLNERGVLEIETAGGKKRVGITRIHVEEDAAKNIHGSGAAGETVVDFNRAGSPLIEIVGEPDLRSAEEAETYLKRLRDVLVFMGVNDGNLEEGSFRCDANVSIRPKGETKFGRRVELKNINSFRFVRKAIESEIARQEALLGSGGTVAQETRSWSEAQGKTIAMRSKEEAHDYRYFPDPDLPPLVVDAAFVGEVRAAMPPLPDTLRSRWQTEFGLTAYDAQVLTGHPRIADYFNEVLDAYAKDPATRAERGKKAANFVQAELLRIVKTNGLRAEIPVPASQIVELLGLIDAQTISGKMAKDVFADMVATGKRAPAIVEAKGLAQVTDRDAIEAVVRAVVEANPAQVEKFKAGKTSVIGFFVGQVMKETKGAASPAVVNELLKKVLG